MAIFCWLLSLYMPCVPEIDPPVRPIKSREQGYADGLNGVFTGSGADYCAGFSAGRMDKVFEAKHADQ